MFNILFVEDDAASAAFLRTVCLQPLPRRRLCHVRDGDQAIAYLRKQAPHHRARRPDLILLDLNLPRVGGLSVLQFVKSSAEFRAIPCIVLSASDDPGDVRAAYDAGAACYITKPATLAAYEHALESSLRMWFEVATLPGRSRSMQLSRAAGA